MRYEERDDGTTIRKRFVSVCRSLQAETQRGDSNEQENERANLLSATPDERGTIRTFRLPLASISPEARVVSLNTLLAPRDPRI